MWELISSNKRKSIALFFLLGFVLLTLSYLFGKAYWPDTDGIVFIFPGLFVWLILAVTAYFSGDTILLGLSHAREVTPEVNPRLYNVVEEIKIAANLPVMPRIYIIDEQSANAFATGRNLSSCAIAVTAGLISKLNRDELQGVIAHEMSHIINRDILYMTFAGVTVGSIALLSHWFLRGLYLPRGSSRRFRSKSSGDGRLQLAFFLIAIIGAFLGQILAQVLYFSISRKREYLADASAVRLTRYPEGLASALEKLNEDDSTLAHANMITAPMYIVNPVKKKGMKFWGLGRTHPPIKERINILRKMAHSAGYRDYQKAYSIVTGNMSTIIPKSGLSEKKSILVRKLETAETYPQAAGTSPEKLGDLLRAVNDFVFLICTCGLKIKLPPEFNQESIKCPRCHTTIPIPSAELVATAAALRGVDTVKFAKKSTIIEKCKPLEYKRKGKGWETFVCVCGRKHNISPAFQTDKFKCGSCGRIIKVAA